MNLLEVPFEVLGSHKFPVQTIRVASFGEFVITGDTERNLCVWQEGNLLYKLELKTKNAKAATSDRLRSAAFSPQGDVFYVASGTQVQAFETSTGARQWSVSFPRVLGFLVSVPLSLDVDPAGRIAIASDNGAFGYRDSLGRKMRQWRTNAAPRWIRWMQGGASLVGSDSFSICLWDSSTGEVLRGYSTDERVYNLESSPRGNRFAVRTLHSVEIYDVDSSVCVAQIRTREGLPLMAFSPDSDYLAVSDEHGARVFQISDVANSGGNELVFEVELTGEAITLSMCFSSNGQALLLGGSDGQIRRYELPR